MMTLEIIILGGAVCMMALGAALPILHYIVRRGV